MDCCNSARDDDVSARDSRYDRYDDRFRGYDAGDAALEAAVVRICHVVSGRGLLYLAAVTSRRN